MYVTYQGNIFLVQFTNDYFLTITAMHVCVLFSNQFDIRSQMKPKTIVGIQNHLIH